MMSISELKDICEVIEKEFGSDTNVVIQLYNDDGSLIHGAYAINCYRDNAGNLYLTNLLSKDGE